MIDMHEESAGPESSEAKQSMRQCKDALRLILAVALGEGLFNVVVPQQQIEGRKGRGTEDILRTLQAVGETSRRLSDKKMMYICNNNKEEVMILTES